MGVIMLNGEEYNGSVGRGGTNIYGAFFDPDRVIYSAFTFDEDPHDWIATEDCILTDNLIPPNENNKACFIQIDGKQVQASYSKIDDPFVYVRKGQTVTYRAKSGSTMKAYGILQGTNGIFAPVIYSDTERRIGVWRDNKPLYQKTVHIANLPNGSPNDWVFYNVGISNLETIANAHGIIHFSNGYQAPLPYVVANPYVETAQVGMTIKASGEIGIMVNTDRSTASAYITVQYTKTTDTAGSGDWTTDGTPTVHYSTNERVIGTWVDSKPLYQKTWIVPKSSLSSGETTYTHNGDLHIKDLVDVRGTVANSRPLVEYHTASNWACSIYNIGNNAFWIYLGSDVYSNMGASATVKVTLQYTKTTD